MQGRRLSAPIDLRIATSNPWPRRIGRRLAMRPFSQVRAGCATPDSGEVELLPNGLAFVPRGRWVAIADASYVSAYSS